jgi:hypothetical protein
MGRDITSLWRLTKAINDEGYSGQKITLEDDDKALTGRTAINTFTKAYVHESNITIPRQTGERNKMQRERKKGDRIK